jgi:hypothetical protein
MCNKTCNVLVKDVDWKDKSIGPALPHRNKKKMKRYVPATSSYNVQQN